MSEPRHKRRRLLIDSFQYRLLGITFVYLAAAVLILATAIFLPLMIDLQGGPAPDSGDAAAAAEFLALHARFWPALGITILLVMLHALVTSHRIAGPLYRFRATYKEIAEGKLQGGVGIRENDYLGKDAEALDAMVEALRERFREIRERRDRAAALLPELRDAVDEDAPERVHELLERLAARMEELDERLAGLRLEGPDTDEPAGTEGAAAEPRTPPPGPEAGGFSLIELLIVVMLIGSIAAIAVPAYMDSLDRARVARAIGDIAAMEEEIRLFYFDHARFPASLDEIDRAGTQDPYGNPYRYLNIANAGGGGGGGGGPGQARKDRFLVPLNGDFDLYSMGKDGESAPALTSSLSQDDVIRANDGGYIGLASEY